MRTQRKAFTLVELLVVMALIAILITMLLVGYPRIDAFLKTTACESNLKSIHQVLSQYAQVYNGWYPLVDAYYGWKIGHTYSWGDGSQPSITPWEALGDLRRMKEMGASPETFFCPMASNYGKTTEWQWESWTDPVTTTSSSNGNKVAYVYFSGYTFLINRGEQYGGSYTDGRATTRRNTCEDDIPIVADDLHYRNSGFLHGWNHGGGTSGDAEGLFNSECNTLFAGGYVVNSKWGELEEQGPGLLHGSAKDMWWFALGKPHLD